MSAQVDSTTPTPLQTTISRGHNFSSKYLDDIFNRVVIKLITSVIKIVTVLDDLKEQGQTPNSFTQYGIFYLVVARMAIALGW